MRWIDLLAKPELVEIHNFSSNIVPIPPEVHCFLGKGSKFIPDRRQHDVCALLHGVQKMRRQLNIAEFFHGKARRKRPHKKKLGLSDWKPPESAQANLYLRLLETELTNYQPFPLRRNFSFWDAKAIQWIRRHSWAIGILDTDKGLGDAIFDRTWINDQLRKLLDEAYE